MIWIKLKYNDILYILRGIVKKCKKDILHLSSTQIQPPHITYNHHQQSPNTTVGQTDNQSPIPPYPPNQSTNQLDSRPLSQPTN